MIITLHPSSIGGSVKAPRSKSAMQRACAAALISKGETIIGDPGNSADDKAALSIIQQLGAKVNQQEDGSIQIISKGITPSSPAIIHGGESGLSIRMFTPLAALANVPVRITGEGSLTSRPMHFFDEVLPLLQVKFSSENGKLPLEVCGPLRPANMEVDGSLSSQFLTGLLMAYAAAEAKGVTITVNHLVSRPYIDLTLDIMRRFGIPVPRNEEYRHFHFEKQASTSISEKRRINIEGDWSGASFLLVAAALAGKITVEGIAANDVQADRSIIKALEAAGVQFVWNETSVTVFRSASIKPFVFDASDCPDLFPPLVALAAYANGISRIKGVSRLKHKESDRALTLQEEFTKMGLVIYQEHDELCIAGVSKLSGAELSSRGDHRIAMALAVAALRADGPSTIHQVEAIRKSYPAFFSDLAVLGASLSLPGQ